MAKYETKCYKNFNELLNEIEDGIINGSISATLEDSSDFISNNARCSVRVFERYSYSGGNRLSLTVTLFQSNNEAINVSCIAAGGSNSIFFKTNRFGEQAFLEKIKEILD